MGPRTWTNRFSEVFFFFLFLTLLLKMRGESGGGDGSGVSSLGPMWPHGDNMVVVEVHTPGQPSAPFPPTKNGIPSTRLPSEREGNG